MEHPKVEGRTPSYKLTYFDIRALGEGPRLLFHQAQVPFEDIRVTREQWAELKPKMPFGQMPVLEVDGNVVAQSAAICRFLGRQFNLVPKCPFEEALVDAIYDAQKDFWAEIKDLRMVLFGFQEGDKEKLLKEQLVPAREKYFTALEKYLKKSGSGYLVGDSVTWADIVISDNLDIFHGLIPDLFDGFSEVKKFVDHINELPNIKKYKAERKPAKF